MTEELERRLALSCHQIMEPITRKAVWDSTAQFTAVPLDARSVDVAFGKLRASAEISTTVRVQPALLITTHRH